MSLAWNSRPPGSFAHYVRIGRFGGTFAWVQGSPFDQSNFFHFDLNKAYLLLCLVLSLVFFTIGNRVVRQRQGVPIGGHASPLIAHLYLLFIETLFFYTYSDQLSHYAQNGQFRWYRYDDDILLLGLPWEFIENHAKPFFRRFGIELNSTNTDPRHAHYLEATFRINEFLEINYYHYSKRDTLGFFVPLLPDFINNCLPRWIYTNTVYARFRAFLFLNANADDVSERISALIDHLVGIRRYPKDIVRAALKKLFRKHRRAFFMPVMLRRFLRRKIREI